MDYVREPDGWLETEYGRIAMFQPSGGSNIDPATVAAFGKEWRKFGAFSDDDISRIGDEYFDIVDREMLGDSLVALDLGCGSGRWTRYIASSYGFVEAVDPSEAVLTAAALTQDLDNVRVTQASVDTIPFADDSFDFLLCLGTLHHIPDTSAALAAAAKKLKPGGWMLLYSYYALENRGPIYRAVFALSSLVRRLVSRLPGQLKRPFCDLIAVLVYLPAISVARLIGVVLGDRAFNSLPLSYYANKSWFVIRNDALDRFGTPLEQRFTKDQIRGMMTVAGLGDIRFSQRAPFWHAVGRKPNS
jgi:SAM-dependent methyltransferase